MNDQYIFLSHASDDIEIVKQFCELMEGQGHRCWYAPRDIQTGRPYQSAVVDAIKNSTALIAFISDATENSEYVSMEVERATFYKKIIFPVRLSDVNMPNELELFLSTKQWLDLFTYSSDQRLPVSPN